MCDTLFFFLSFFSPSLSTLLVSIWARSWLFDKAASLESDHEKNEQIASPSSSFSLCFTGETSYPALRGSARWTEECSSSIWLRVRGARVDTLEYYKHNKWLRWNFYLQNFIFFFACTKCLHWISLFLSSYPVSRLISFQGNPRRHPLHRSYNCFHPCCVRCFVSCTLFALLLALFLLRLCPTKGSRMSMMCGM